VSRTLSRLLEESESADSSSGFRSWNGEVTHPAASDRGREILHGRIAASIRSFLAAVEAMGIAASIDSPQGPGREARITRTRVVLVTEEITRMSAEAVQGKEQK
jgi:hypothetical protein